MGLLASHFRGCGGVAKIVAEPPSSIIDFWICYVSPICFPEVIIISLLKPFTQVKQAPDDAYR
jgi:hypothetical protein